MGSAPVVRMTGISKRFGGVQALRGVDFDLFPGEVHVLLGENGAGKSTLVKILSGVEIPDEGTIEVDGTPVHIDSPARARELGIATIFQEFSLAPHLTVAENLHLPHLPIRALRRVDQKQLWEGARRVLDKLGANVDPDAPIFSLTVAERQLVEIGRALMRDARVLIMDEPTAALSAGEIAQLFETVRRLKRAGVAILYISHRLEEVHQLGDRVTVFRDGRRVGTRPAAGVTVDELVAMMVGREVKRQAGSKRTSPGPVVLEVRGLNRSGVFRNIDFSVRAGETVGIAGLVGSGAIGLAHSLFGDPPPEAGQIFLNGNPFTPASPRVCIRSGIGFIPEDRKHDGLVTIAPVAHNLTLPQLARFSRRGVLSLRREAEAAWQLVQRLGVVTAGIGAPAASLSGGNQQKLVVGKWIQPSLGLLIVAEPTRGVDVGAREEIYAVLEELKAQGVAIVVVSSDFQEVIRLSDQILVMRRGEIVGRMAAEEASQERLLALAIGGEAA